MRILKYRPTTMTASEEIRHSEILSAIRTEEVNGEHALDVETTADLQLGDRLLTRDATGKWREWVVQGVDGGHGLGSYHCVWSLQADLSTTTVSVMPGVQSPVSALQALIAALSTSDTWSAGSVFVTASSGASMYQMSTWEALSVLVENWGGEIDASIEVDEVTGEVTARYVVLYAQQGQQYATRRFEYSRDTSDVRREGTAERLVCRIIPRGKGEETESGGHGRKIDITSVNGGIAWLEDETMAQVLRRKVGNGWEYPTIFVDNGDIDDPAELKAWGLKVLHDYTRPSYSYSFDVAQVGVAGQDVTGVQLGDLVQVVDTSYADGVELRMEARIMGLKTDELCPSRQTVTVGAIAGGMASALGGLSKRVGALEGGVTDLQATTHTSAEFFDDVLGSINAEINGTGGYFYLTDGQGVRTYDTPVSDPLIGAEAHKVTEMKGGSIRFAETKTSGGDWNWRTLITSGHVAADLITAVQVTSGYIGSRASGNYINLDTGEVLLSNVSDLEDDVTALGARVDDANLQEQTIYISATSGTSTVALPSEWVTRTDNVQRYWTARRPVYDEDSPVLFVATQRKAVDGEVTCTPAVIDQTTTVIDGGHISTGTIDAQRVSTYGIKAQRFGNSDSVYAEVGDITMDHMDFQGIVFYDGTHVNTPTLGLVENTNAVFIVNDLNNHPVRVFQADSGGVVISTPGLMDDVQGTVIGGAVLSVDQSFGLSVQGYDGTTPIPMTANLPFGQHGLFQRGGWTFTTIQAGRTADSGIINVDKAYSASNMWQVFLTLDTSALDSYKDIVLSAHVETERGFKIYARNNGSQSVSMVTVGWLAFGD